MNNKFSILILLIVIFFSSCKEDKVKIVKMYNVHMNQYDSSNVRKILSSDFTITSNQLLNSRTFAMDSLKSIKSNIKLLSVTDNDSTIKTIELWTSKLDTVLGMNSYLKMHNTYTISKGNIVSIRTDSIENLSQYRAEYDKKTSSFNDYLDFEFKNLNKTERQSRLLELWEKYSSLSDTEKAEYKVMRYIKGSTFISNNTFVPMTVKFTGRRSVLVSSFGFKIPTTFTIDDNIIHVTPIDGSYPLVLTIKNNETMIAPSLMGDFIFKRLRR